MFNDFLIILIICLSEKNGQNDQVRWDEQIDEHIGKNQHIPNEPAEKRRCSQRAHEQIVLANVKKAAAQFKNEHVQVERLVKRERL